MELNWLGETYVVGDYVVRYCKEDFLILKEDLPLAKQIITDNTGKTALLHMKSKNDDIRNLSQCKIDNKTKATYKSTKIKMTDKLKQELFEGLGQDFMSDLNEMVQNFGKE